MTRALPHGVGAFNVKCPTAVIAVTAVAALAGCTNAALPSATPTAMIHIVNRSNTALLLGPGFLIPSCGAVSTTSEEYEKARSKAAQILDGTVEVPAGAVLWESPAFAGPEAEVTVIISGAAPLDAKPGVVAEADLPACGGPPVGIGPEVLPDPSGPDLPTQP